MTYMVAVRAMCEFTARRGDLDLRFTPAPTSLEGMAGHVTVAGRRANGYETEITLTGTHRGLTLTLPVEVDPRSWMHHRTAGRAIA